MQTNSSTFIILGLVSASGHVTAYESTIVAITQSNEQSDKIEPTAIESGANDAESRR